MTLTSIFRALAVSTAMLAFTAAPGFTYTINLGGTYVEPSREMEYIQYFIAAPYTHSLQDGQLQFLAEGGVNFMESWSSLEVGLGHGFASSIAFPYDVVQPRSGKPSSTNLSGLTWTLSRQLWKNDTSAGRLRFRADKPLGSDDSPTYLGLLGSAATQLTPALRGTVNLNYYSSLPRTVQSLAGTPDVGWGGNKVQLDTALDYSLTRNLSVVLEQMAHWQLPSATASGGSDPRSASFSLQLAPGLTYKFSDSFAIQGSVAMPVLVTGNQSSLAPWTAIAGTCWDF